MFLLFTVYCYRSCLDPDTDLQPAWYKYLTVLILILVVQDSQISAALTEADINIDHLEKMSDYKSCVKVIFIFSLLVKHRIPQLVEPIYFVEAWIEFSRGNYSFFSIRLIDCFSVWIFILSVGFDGHCSPVS